jgi:NAD-dependent SIR2 family protein deacetylase
MSASTSNAIPIELAQALRRARFVVALTGAGVSAESGLATFRDAQTGLWARFDPRELATPSAFARNPKLVWDWYAWRRENVDGLHQRAGSRRVVELHGSIARVKCSREGTIVARWETKPGEVPRCTGCRSSPASTARGSSRSIRMPQRCRRTPITCCAARAASLCHNSCRRRPHPPEAATHQACLSGSAPDASTATFGGKGVT